MDVSRKVLDGVALYMAHREAIAAAEAMLDKLGAHTRHLSEREYQAYLHITGMWDIAHNGHVQPPTIHAESVPMPALTPERLAALDLAATHTELVIP